MLVFGAMPLLVLACPSAGSNAPGPTADAGQ